MVYRIFSERDIRGTSGWFRREGIFGPDTLQGCLFDYGGSPVRRGGEDFKDISNEIKV